MKLKKEIREIVEKLTQQGWRIDERENHLVAFPPDRSKRQVTIPSTPGGGRWKQNLIADLRRSGADL